RPARGRMAKCDHDCATCRNEGAGSGLLAFDRAVSVRVVAKDSPPSRQRRTRLARRLADDVGDSYQARRRPSCLDADADRSPPADLRAGWRSLASDHLTSAGHLAEYQPARDEESRYVTDRHAHQVRHLNPDRTRRPHGDTHRRPARNFGANGRTLAADDVARTRNTAELQAYGRQVAAGLIERLVDQIRHHNEGRFDASDRNIDHAARLDLRPG